MIKTGLAGMNRSRFYQEYRRRLDGRAVLEHYGAQNCREQAGPDGTTEIVHSCLLDRVEPHHSNGDQNPSACLNVEKKLYVCYSLGWGGDLFHLIRKMENADTLTDITPLVGSMLTGTTRDADEVRKEIDQLFAQPTYTVDLPSYSERVLAPWLVSHPYMRDERGIDQDAHQVLKLGYDPAINRIIFPHFVEGTLVGWQTRAIPNRPGQWPGTVPDWPKYKNTAGFPKSETLYALDLADRSKPVIVVESPMSVAKAVTLGLTNVVATFGAKVTTHQMELLRDFPRVTVWFDDDPAGRAGERKLVDALWRHTDVLAVVPEEGRDLGDHTSVSSVQVALQSARPASMIRADYAISERYRR